MNSKVIKFVAGGGKTTYSKSYLSNNKNGLYLAFTNSVIDEVGRKGFLSKTIDSFFTSYVIPKVVCLIPLISDKSKITFVDTNMLSNNLKNVSKIWIDKDGTIYNNNSKVDININEKNEYLHGHSYFKNSYALKFIFDKEKLRLTHKLRASLCDYIIFNYPKLLVDLIKSRFDYIIIDEAQDLNGYRENFVKLLYEYEMPMIILGDDNQNITGGGEWFENIPPDEEKNKSFRCPENNCKWIREKLNIEIYGNDDYSEFIIIDYNDVKSYDDGNRFLLYQSSLGKDNARIISDWVGPKDTIKSAKGQTINQDIIIIGKNLNDKNLYTAITRTKRNVYSTIKK